MQPPKGRLKSEARDSVRQILRAVARGARQRIVIRIDDETTPWSD
jgi:hypothetical protein